METKTKQNKTKQNKTKQNKTKTTIPWHWGRRIDGREGRRQEEVIESLIARKELVLILGCMMYGVACRIIVAIIVVGLFALGSVVVAGI